MSWHALERGTGRPLVLLHGIGMSHEAWAPLLSHLTPHRRVIAFDIAGFGQTPPLTGPVTLDALLAGLRDSLKARGINEPVDLVGNSMGGWLALGAAQRGLARSVVAISPAGLSPREKPPAHIRLTFAMTRFAAQHTPGLSRRLVASPVIRTLALAIPMTPRGWRMPVYAAQRALEDFGQAPGFDATFDAIHPLTGLDRLTVPVTVAFGRLDALLTGDYRRRDGLPVHARWIAPLTWGHVPMWDDPAGVAQVILNGTT